MAIIIQNYTAPGSIAKTTTSLGVKKLFNGSSASDVVVTVTQHKVDRNQMFETYGAVDYETMAEFETAVNNGYHPSTDEPI